LQEQLGEEFQVLNLATPGAQIMEFGGIAAETLRDDFPRLIVVTNHYPGNPLAEPDGHSQGTYFFWDAYYRGLLAKDMDREARLAKLARARRDDEKFAELKRQMRLDSWLAYRDLWTMMGHEHVWTLWNPTVAGAFTKARKHYRDVEFGPEGPPKHPRFTAPDARVMEVLRARIGPGYQKALSSLPPESNDGPPYANALERAVKLSCPAPLRKRTLITLNRLHPYYVDRLTSQEKAMHEQLYAAAAHTLETAGFTAINVERDNPYPRSAYFDHVHLSEEGGERLARDLAPKIQELARRLGYVGAKD
jgi:hypothetical protein